MPGKLRKVLKISIPIAILFTGVAAYFGYNYYNVLFKPNVNIDSDKTFLLYIPTGSDFDVVMDSLIKNKILKDSISFSKAADLKKYKKKIRPGRFELISGMNNNQVIDLLRAGKQKPVKLTFNNVRTAEQLAGKISEFIEADSASIYALLNNGDKAREFGLTKETFLSLFLPDTYEFYWNTDAQEFIERMHKEYKKFWNENRTSRAKELGLTPIEISILASIVQAEQSSRNDEKPLIAGLYINRLHRGMALQSDPTLIFASGDFTRQRVLNADKEIESPYNTYKYTGLPPGPINIPEISSIKAVLNYKESDFIYMCAKEDFSGYHNFAETLSEHNRNAQKYQQALNRKNIKR